jgi:hypothetical protein
MITGFVCVDIREWYYHSLEGVQPTNRGIALRLSEWEILKEVIAEVNEEYRIL